jgi:hypothetical protein
LVAAVEPTVTAMIDTQDVPNFLKHPQEANLLCWAASTQVVVGALGQPREQYTIATYAMVPPTPVADFNAMEQICKTSIDTCNVAAAPALAQLGFTFDTSFASLSPDLIIKDIKDNKRPIIFGWRYANDTQESAHFLVIIGYKGDENAPNDLQLHIFDPLPKNHGSVQYISLKNYDVTAPMATRNDMGVPIDLYISYYRIKASSAPPAASPLPSGGLGVPGPSGGPPGPEPAPALPETHGMDPQLTIKASSGAARAEVARREAQDRIKLSAGFPLPIIALGLKELRAADETSALAFLRRNSGTVLYPVQSGDRVYDSFLLIKRGDEWLAGGYANTTVTRLLVEQRDQYAHSDRERAEHYLLSVPALGAFFLARGTGADACLIPVTDDRSIRVGEDSLQANRPYRADQLMPALSAAARSARTSPYTERRPG